MSDQYERLMAAVRELGAEVLAVGAGPHATPDPNVQRLHRAVELEARVLEASALLQQAKACRHSPKADWVFHTQRELDALIQQREEG